MGNARAKVNQVIHGIGAAAGESEHFAASQYEDGRFARNSGDFAEDEFIGDEIGQNQNALLGELLDQFGQVS